MRKPAHCLCKNKCVDQLQGNCASNQRHCFPYIDSTIPLLPKSEVSSVAVQPNLCRTWEDRFSHDATQAVNNKALILKLTKNLDC